MEGRPGARPGPPRGGLERWSGPGRWTRRSPRDYAHAICAIRRRRCRSLAGTSVKSVQRQLGHAPAAMPPGTYADRFPSDPETVAGAMTSIPWHGGGMDTGLTKRKTPLTWANSPGGEQWSRRELNPGPPPSRQGFSVRSSRGVSARPSGSGEHVRMTGPAARKVSQPGLAANRAGEPLLVDARVRDGGHPGLTDTRSPLRRRGRSRAECSRRLIVRCDACGGPQPAPARFPWLAVRSRNQNRPLHAPPGGSCVYPADAPG